MHDAAAETERNTNGETGRERESERRKEQRCTNTIISKHKNDKIEEKERESETEDIRESLSHRRLRDCQRGSGNSMS